MSSDLFEFYDAGRFAFLTNRGGGCCWGGGIAVEMMQDYISRAIVDQGGTFHG